MILMCNICTKIGKCLSPAIIYFLKTVVLFTFPEFDAFWGWLMLLFSHLHLHMHVFTSCLCDFSVDFVSRKILKNMSLLEHFLNVPQCPRMHLASYSCTLAICILRSLIFCAQHTGFSLPCLCNYPQFQKVATLRVLEIFFFTLI